MKTNEVTNLLNKIVELLSLFPDKDIASSLDEIIFIVNKSKDKKTIKKNNKRKSVELDKINEKKINDLLQNINSMNISDIEKELSDNDLFKAMKDIRKFAESIGLTIGTRQKRSSTIHTIIKHIERSRINKTISERAE